MKQVYCLYRVSSEKQLNENDIPMQRDVCHQFAKEQRWHIKKELYEKGVSGFKISMKDREVMQQIKKAAEQRHFDILLVFMFDRLGRRDYETPFFVEELASHGIEIWSAKEGQQRFDDHADRLLNYIRFWQATGESVKTSIRTKTRLGQLAQEERFCGGLCPYGYNVVKQGRINKRGHDVHDLVINETEAEVVRRIFYLCINYGYGSRRISSELASQGIYNRVGKPFHYSSITVILKNIRYMGILKSGEIKSAIIPNLQIIDEDTFNNAQRLIFQRQTEQRENASIPLSTLGKTLLSGNIFCGHCGGRLCASTAKGGAARISIYKCGYTDAAEPLFR